MPVSSPTSLVIAAAASTSRIRLGTTVSVLSTDEPIRVFQQLATAAAIAPGRIDVVAGRGSSAITFPIFDLDERRLRHAVQLQARAAARAQSPRARHVERPAPAPPPRRHARSSRARSSRCGSGSAPAAARTRCCAPSSSACRCSSASSAARRSTGRSTAAPTATPGRRSATPPRPPTSPWPSWLRRRERPRRQETYLEHELRMFQTGSAEIGRPMRAPTGQGGRP